MSKFFEPAAIGCPEMYGEDQCIDPSKIKPDFGMAPVYLSLCSCIASMFGSVLMIIPYVLWKDIRSGLRMIVTYLAIADFFTAFGYTIASFNYIHYKNNQDNDYITACRQFDSVCQIQAYISSWASLSSFWWTAILAFYLYFMITKENTDFITKRFPFFHVFVWGSPILVMFPLLISGSLGYSLFSAGGWCFIASEKEATNYVQYKIHHSMSPIIVIKILAGGKAVEIATYVTVFVLYGIICFNIYQKKKQAISAETDFGGYVDLLKHMEKKMYAIPIAFVLLRIWGTLQFFLSIAVFAKGGTIDITGCVSPSIYYTYLFLACIQSIGDGGQGWANAILYIFFSPKIRSRLLKLIKAVLLNCVHQVFSRDTPQFNRRNVNENSLLIADYYE